MAPSKKSTGTSKTNQTKKQSASAHTSAIANRMLLATKTYEAPRALRTKGFGQHDRREYNPTKKLAPPANTIRRSTRLVIKSAAHPSRNVPRGIKFDSPKRIAICIRRNIRREILHAIGVAGRRGNGNRTKRKTIYSGISC